jgi:hypothetical protein
MSPKAKGGLTPVAYGPSARGILGILGILHLAFSISIWHLSFGIWHLAFSIEHSLSRPAFYSSEKKDSDFLELSGKLWQSTL